MAYVVKIALSKPASASWFYQSSTAAVATLANIAAWNIAQTGYLDSVGQMLTPNSHVTLMIFDTMANGEAWVTARLTQADNATREAYYAAQGIIEMITTYS